GAPPDSLAVGYDFTGNPDGQKFGANLWCDANPLNANGTITSVRADFDSVGQTIAFFLISPANVIRSVTPNLTSVVGEHTYAVDLAGEAGDFIGVWSSGSSGVRRTEGVTGVSTFIDIAGAKPAPGDPRARLSTVASRALWIYGTN